MLCRLEPSTTRAREYDIAHDELLELAHNTREIHVSAHAVVDSASVLTHHVELVALLRAQLHVRAFENVEYIRLLQERDHSVGVRYVARTIDLIIKIL